VVGQEKVCLSHGRKKLKSLEKIEINFVPNTLICLDATIQGLGNS